ncbi:hypothetical protein ACWEO2_43030 [Nocardia sp. NPDC004278]
MRQDLAERGKSGEDRQALLDELLAIVIDPQIADEDFETATADDGTAVRGRPNRAPAHSL